MDEHGGKRKGAGRPKGSGKKPKFSDYMTKEQAEKLVHKAHELASNGDPIMLKFVIEQYFGKAAQTLQTEDKDGNKMPILAPLHTLAKTEEPTKSATADDSEEEVISDED